VKALSIRQPWVELILEGQKTLEIRGWKTKYRGELYLHSAFNIDRAALKRYRLEEPQRSAIVGKVQLDDVEELTEAKWHDLAKYHLSTWPWDSERCRYGFWLSSPERLSRPRPCMGRSFLFQPEFTSR
jgi:hypothetical protein